MLFVRLSRGEHGPCRPRHPVRQRHRRHVPVTPRQQALEPLAAPVPLLLPGQLGDPRPGPIDPQAAPIPVAPFRDPQQPLLAIGGIRFRDPPEPGRTLPAVPAHARIAQGGQQRRGRHRPHPGKGHPQLRRFVCPGPLLDPPVVPVPPLVHGHPLVVEVRQDLQEPRPQIPLPGSPMAQHRRHGRTDLAAPLGHLDAELGQPAADWVHRGRPVAHRPGPDPVAGLLRRPVRALDPHEPPVRALERRADRGGVGAVVLVGLDVRLPELRRHELGLRPHRQDLPAPRLGPSAGFHAHHAGGPVGPERLPLRRLPLPVNAGATRVVDAVDRDRVLRQINADEGGSGPGGNRAIRCLGQG